MLMTDRENPRKFPVGEKVRGNVSASLGGTANLNLLMLGFLDTPIHEENLHSKRNFPGKGRVSKNLTHATDYFIR